MSDKEILDKAYGNFNKEVPGYVTWDWIPTRTFKFYYLKVVRYFTR